MPNKTRFLIWHLFFTSHHLCLWNCVLFGYLWGWKCQKAAYSPSGDWENSHSGIAVFVNVIHDWLVSQLIHICIFFFFFWEKIIKVFDFKRSSPSAKLEIYPSHYSLSKFLIVIREKNSEIWLGRWEVVSLEEGAVSGRSSLPFSASKKKIFFPPFNWATYSTRCIENISIELCFFLWRSFCFEWGAQMFQYFQSCFVKIE